MSEAPSDLAALEASLRRVHRSVLVLIVVCGLVAVTQQADPDATPERTLTVAAVGLALVSVVARRAATAPFAPPRRRLWLALLSLGAGAALAAVGAVAAAVQGQVQTGFLFCAAALVFCLRPPRLGPVAPRASR